MSTIDNSKLNYSNIFGQNVTGHLSSGISVHSDAVDISGGTTILKNEFAINSPSSLIDMFESRLVHGGARKTMRLYSRDMSHMTRSQWFVDSRDEQLPTSMAESELVKRIAWAPMGIGRRALGI